MYVAYHVQLHVCTPVVLKCRVLPPAKECEALQTPAGAHKQLALASSQVLLLVLHGCHCTQPTHSCPQLSLAALPETVLSIIVVIPPRNMNNTGVDAESHRSLHSRFP